MLVLDENMFVGPSAVSRNVSGFSYILLMVAIISSGIPYMDGI